MEELKQTLKETQRKTEDEIAKKISDAIRNEPRKVLIQIADISSTDLSTNIKKLLTDAGYGWGFIDDSTNSQCVMNLFKYLTNKE